MTMKSFTRKDAQKAYQTGRKSSTNRLGETVVLANQHKETEKQFFARKTALTR